VDGFNLAYAVTPETFVAFIDLVVGNPRPGDFAREDDLLTVET